MTRFEVQFTDPKNYFYPGESIAGNIIVLCDEPVTCRRILLTFYGESFSKWTEGSGDSREWHYNTEEYFNTTIILLAPSPPHSNITLSPGNVILPFQIRLPRNLPPSFDVKRYIVYVAYVRYLMIIRIQDGISSGRKANIITQIPFQVSLYIQVRLSRRH